MIRFLRLSLLTLLALATPLLARAGLLVTTDVSSINLTPGQQARITLTVKPGDTSAINFYDLTLQFSSATVQVGFTTPPTGAPINDPSTDSDYVFYNNTLATGYPGFISDTPSGLNTQLELTDFTSNFGDVSLTSSGALLGVIFLKAPNTLPPPGGEHLLLTLSSADIESLTDFSLYDAGSFTSIPITLSATAVPEPATLGLLLSGAPMGFLVLYRYRKTA